MKKIKLNTVNSKSPNYKKYCALIDDEDCERVRKYNWTVRFNKNIVYASTELNGKNVYMHNFIMNNKGIDHINNDGLDNQKHNLRIVTQAQNNMNKRSLKSATSKYKGVSLHSQGKWRAKCGNDYLGVFDTEKEAGIAYNERAYREKYDFRVYL